MVMHVASIGQEEVQLRWNPSTDNVGVAGYNIWLNAEYYGTTSDTTFVLSLDVGFHALAVSAFDAAGNESELSIALMVEIKDTESPSIPYELIIVYPNPTYGGKFVVMISEEIKYPSILQILTPDGRMVYQRPLVPQPAMHKELFEWEENFLVPGLYVIALIENDIRIGYTLLTVVGPPKYSKIALN